jgi:hypothetical protein
MLYRTGLITPRVRGADHGAADQFSPADLYAFLVRLLDGAEPVTAATAGQINIPEAGAGSREGRGDVLPAGCINYADLKGKPDLPGLGVRNLA